MKILKLGPQCTICGKSTKEITSPLRHALEHKKNGETK